MKQFSYAGFRHKRQFRTLTGVTPAVFQTMIKRLRPHWRERIVAAKKRSGRPWRVGELEDHLLVLLLLYRGALTQDFVACLYGTDQSVISRAMRRIENLAARVLGVKRAIRVSREEAAALIFDCTEQPIQRPGRKQRCWYSGQKNAIPSRPKSPLRSPAGSSASQDPHRAACMTSPSDAAGRRSRKTLMPMSIAAIRGCSKTIPRPNCPTRKAKRNR